MKHSFSKIAILFPVIIMLLWVLSLTFPGLLGTEIRLKIEGYDPRDLLSGHYLQFQVNYEIPPFCKANRIEPVMTQCVCLTRPQNTQAVSKATWAGNCNERPANCDIYIQGNCQNSRFIAGIERFYIPETFKIQRIPKGATVVLKVMDGKASVQDIEVNGKPLLNSLAP